MSGLSQDEIKTYKEQFNAVDTDGSGYLEIGELSRLQRKCGFKGSDRELCEAFLAVDKNNDKRISFDEYLAVMAQKPKKDRTDAEWRVVFNKWDKDGSGSINQQEMRKVCAARGFSQSQADHIFKAVDRSGDGEITIDEFLAAM